MVQYKVRQDRDSATTMRGQSSDESSRIREPIGTFSCRTLSSANVIRSADAAATASCLECVRNCSRLCGIAIKPSDVQLFTISRVQPRNGGPAFVDPRLVASVEWQSAAEWELLTSCARAQCAGARTPQCGARLQCPVVPRFTSVGKHRQQGVRTEKCILLSMLTRRSAT